jgi:16S rRNA (uracil1498-N3)-methyltransferase
MGNPIFYASPDEIEEGENRISFHGDESWHLVKSLRIKTGESLLVGDGKGTRYEVTVTSAAPGEVSARIESVTRIEREVPAITLIQAMSRPRHMDETIIRAAEAGADRVVPFMAPRSSAGSRVKIEGRSERWNKLAREACKVARRVWPLEVGHVDAWPPDQALLKSGQLNIVLWEDERSNGLADVLPVNTPTLIGIVAGPEGGFSEAEARTLEEIGCVKASVGNLILRSETAGPYAVMLVRYHYGILRPSGA